jgi:4-hydroxy-tetrahydrodipicolinate synthase
MLRQTFRRIGATTDQQAPLPPAGRQADTEAGGPAIFQASFQQGRERDLELALCGLGERRRNGDGRGGGQHCGIGRLGCAAPAISHDRKRFVSGWRAFASPLATSYSAEIFHTGTGVSVLIFLGSLGENQALAPEEKRRMIEAMVRVISGRIPVLSGVAESSTAEACRYVRDGERLGLDGFMLMPAMLYKGDEREIVMHFRTAAKATGLPIMIYNNPVSYANDITPEMFAELADVKNFVALKESSGNVRRITDLHNVVGDRYAIFTGVDDLVLESAILGIDGWVAGTGIAFPEENQYLWELTRRGEWEKAREIYRWFTPLLHLDTHVKLVQYIKLAVQECGLGAEWVRLPRLPLAGEERKQILKIIRDGMAKRPKVPRRR